MLAAAVFADIMIRTNWTFVGILKAIVIVAACVAIVYIALRVFGVTIPPWVVQIFWVVVAAVIAIIAIDLIASL